MHFLLNVPKGASTLIGRILQASLKKRRHQTDVAMWLHSHRSMGETGLWSRRDETSRTAASGSKIQSRIYGIETKEGIVRIDGESDYEDYVKEHRTGSQGQGASVAFTGVRLYVRFKERDDVSHRHPSARYLRLQCIYFFWNILKHSYLHVRALDCHKEAEAEQRSC